MKILFTTCLLVISISSWSQQYLNQTAVWNQQFTLEGPRTYQVTYTKYYMNGDSLYNGKLYYKVFAQTLTIVKQGKFDSIGQPIVVTDTFRSNQFSRMIREDNKRFMQIVASGDERQLYDFNLNVGDLAGKAASHSCTPANEVVLNRYDTVCIGGKARKRWWLNMVPFLSATALIEGVGPNTGIFNPICNNTCPECSYFLQSFILNGDTLYKGSCSGAVGIIERKPQEEVQLAMLDDAIQISLTGNFNVDLYHISGALVYQAKAVEDKHLIKYKGTLPAGVYLLQLHHGNTRYAKKVIISD